MSGRRVFVNAVAALVGTAALALVSGAQAADPVKAGFIYVSPVGDAGWTYQHDVGRKEMEKVSKQFPKVAFLHATGYKMGPNFGIYNARFYEGRYLNGVIAGKMTKTNILGYVAAFPIPEVLQGINAFTRGARSVNPKAEVRVIWTSSWYDPGKEREAATTLISQNADVLTHHTDSTAVVQTAEEKGKYAFAYHSDMSKYGPKAQLSATTHHWGE